LTDIGAALLALMRARDLQPKQVAAMIRRSKRTFYYFLDGRASARVEAQVILTFPDLHTFAHHEKPLKGKPYVP
jgi:hypothetical protein